MNTLLGLGHPDPLHRLAAGRRLIEQLIDQRTTDIAAALKAGHTWAEIAEALDDTELGIFLDHHHLCDQAEAEVPR